MTLLYVRNRINELMGRWVASLKGAASMSQTDLNIVSEYVAMQLLREVYDWPDLCNLNTESANYPGIDLADDNARVAIQITSKTSLDKVKHTLSEFADEKRKLYERYDRLIIYMLVEKQGSYSDRTFDDIILHRFKFDKDRDILDYRDLLAAIQEFPIERAQRVLDILEANFGDDTRSTSSPTLAACRSNLPPDPGCFGRTAEIRQIQERLTCEDAVPIVSIFGMGGAGKTTLALHAAHELMEEQDRYQHARLYIDLRGTDPVPLDAMDALISLLNLILDPDPNRPRDLGLLAGLWRDAICGKDALLCLDNAYSAEQVRPLLPGSATCAVLITSRQHFDLKLLPGELRVDLPPMPLEEARDLLQTLVPRLDAGAADRIAALCGCLPLALRIAGSYLSNRQVTPEEYARRLADERTRLARLLDRHDPDFDVYANIYLSVKQLDADLRRSWALLSLFPAPYDRDAAAVLWGESQAPVHGGALAWLDDVKAQLQAGLGPDAAGLADTVLNAFLQPGGPRPDLPDTSTEPRMLLVPMGTYETTDLLDDLLYHSLLSFDGTSRSYFQHDLVRLAASRVLDDLGDVDAEAARQRLARHYLVVCRMAKAFYTTGGESIVKGLSLFDREWPHIKAGQAWAASRAGENDEAARICNAYPDAASDLLLLRLHPGEYVAWLEAGRRAAHRLGDQQGEANHLGGLAVAYRMQRDLDRAEAACRRALDLVSAEDRRNKGRLLNSLGNIYMQREELAEAINCFQQALEIETENRKARLVPLGSLGLAYQRLGQLDRAAEYFTEALEIARETGEWQLEAVTLGNLGDLYWALGKPGMAIKRLNEALELEHSINDPSSRAKWLFSLGRIHNERGDIAETRDCWTQAIEILEAAGEPVAGQIRRYLSKLEDSFGPPSA